MSTLLTAGVAGAALLYVLFTRTEADAREGRTIFIVYCLTLLIFVVYAERGGDSVAAQATLMLILVCSFILMKRRRHRSRNECSSG